MLNLLRMDIHRILNSKVFYVALAIMTIMAIATPLSGMATSLSEMMGITSAAGGEAFMTGSMGTGTVFILIGIVLTLFICGDYSGGFSKNIFSRHADSKDYILSKLASMLLLSAFMLILFTIEAVVVLLVLGLGVSLEGGLAGLLLFLLQKWIASGAFISIIMLVCLATRNTAVGVIAGFLVATGGLAMGLELFAQMVGLDFVAQIKNVLVSGVSSLPTFTFDSMVFVQILAVSAVWIAACAFLSKRILKTKDVE